MGFIIRFSPCLYGHCKDTYRGKQQTEVKQARPDLEQHYHSSNFVSNLGITLFCDKYASIEILLRVPEFPTDVLQETKSTKAMIFQDYFPTAANLAALFTVRPFDIFSYLLESQDGSNNPHFKA